MSNEVALITGGGSGIGAAVADRLAARGTRLALVDRNAATVAAKAAELDALPVVADVRDPDALAGAIAEAEQRYGALHLVHLNAGMTGKQPALDQLDVAAYRALLGVNVDHVVYGVTAAVPALRRAGGGTIIATASLAGLVPMPDDPLYTLTKHAVVGYVRAAGEALTPDGIRLAAVCPGFADTPLLDDTRHVFEDFPLLTADDVAAAVESMLTSAESGEAWYVQPGRPAAPYRFHGVPGPTGGQRPPRLDQH